MFSLAGWPNATIGHIFLAVVAARMVLPGARLAERQAMQVVVLFALVCGFLLFSICLCLFP
jgi:hypothetical protein